MDSFTESLMSSALSQKDVYPKAIASFLFREVIEDAHTKYNISQEDMKQMCKEAVNRAAMFLSIKDDPKLYKALAIHAINGIEWDDAEMTDEILEQLALLKELAE